MPFSHETSIYFFQIVTDITCGFLKIENWDMYKQILCISFIAG